MLNNIKNTSRGGGRLFNFPQPELATPLILEGLNKLK
nr:MAG TPA: hypothetical protein [Caudoviricetes sp.]